MSRKPRFRAAKKVEILREHIENQVSGSDLAERYKVTPSQVYQCKKQLFEGALEVLKLGKKERNNSREINELKQTLADRDSVLLRR